MLSNLWKTNDSMILEAKIRGNEGEGLDIPTPE